MIIFTPNSVIKSADVNLNFNNLKTGVDIDNGVIALEKMKATIACRAYNSTSQSITSGAARKVTLDVENFDAGNNFDTANSRFAVPTTGYYHVDAGLEFQNVAAGEQGIIFIYVGGSVVATSKGYGPVLNDDPSATVSTVLYATAGQFIELYAQCTSTKSLLGLSDRTFMSIYYIGA